MSLFKETTKGMVWTTTATIIKALVGLLQISILTRFLDIGDFGTIAIATVFIGFTQIFLDLGISIGIMHKQEISKEELSSLFWLNIFMGLLLTILLIGIAPYISMFYDDQALTPIIMLLSLTVFLASLGSQHRTIQHKKLRFKYMAVIELIGAFVTMTVAVLFAINGFGVYSLVYSTLAGVGVSNLTYLIFGLWKDNNIQWYFRFKDTYPFLKIGAFSIGSRTLDYFSRELDIIFIGSYFGKEVLGGYTLCKKIVQMVYAFINPIVIKVLTPLFAQIQSDKERISVIYRKLIESLAITNLPIYFLIALSSKTILHYLYGEQYVQWGFILSVLAIYYGILSLSNPVGTLQIAFGRTDLGFYWTIYRVISTLVIVYISSFYTIELMVLMFLILSIVNTIALWRFQILIMLKISFGDYFSSIWRPLLLITIITFPLFIIFWHEVNLLKSIITIIIGLIIYSYCVIKLIPESFLSTKIRFHYLKYKK